MTSAIKMSHLALVETLMKALQGVGHAPTLTVSVPRFLGRPESPGDPTIDEWLSDFDVFVRQCGVPVGERTVVLVDYLDGCAKEEVLCHPCEVRRDFGALVSLLRRVFGPRETVTSFYSRVQLVGETLAEFSRALIRLHQRIESAAPTVAERQALAVLGDGALKHQFVVGVRDEWVRHELRRLMFRSADKPFIVVREEALCLMCEEEARVVQMRSVETAAPALSDPVGGSVSCMLGLDAVVLDDGDDMSVPCGGDVELCGVDTVVPGAVSGCLCALDSVSRGDLVVRVDEMSLSRGGDAVVSGVDESGCYVNSVLADGIIDLCGVDKVVSGVDTVVSGVDTVVSGVDTVVSGVDTVVSGVDEYVWCQLDYDS